MPNHTKELIQRMSDMGPSLGVNQPKVRSFTKVLCFSTLFAEWEPQEGDHMIHLFPRGGTEDEYFDGRYDMEATPPRYLPGRFEAASGLEFPDNIVDLIKAAGNIVWFGDAMYDYIPELKAYAVRFVDVSSVKDIGGEGGFVDQFLTHIDNALDN